MSSIDYLTVSQAADRLNMTPRGVLRRIKAGTLPAVKIGAGTSPYLIRREDVDAAPTSARKARQ